MRITNLKWSNRLLRWPLIVIGELIIIALVLRAGMLIGFRKAMFSYQWGANYNHMFGGPRRGWFASWDTDDYISGHGAAGRVLKVEGNAITLKSNDATEKVVETSDQTVIRDRHQTLSIGDIAPDDQLMVIGTPSTSTGQIEAKFIRVFKK